MEFAGGTGRSTLVIKQLGQTGPPAKALVERGLMPQITLRI
jgi:hypothetical protein